MPDFPRPFHGNKNKIGLKKDKAPKAGADSYDKASKLMNFAAEIELMRRATPKITREIGGPNMGHSPNEMGHSPAEMNYSPNKMNHSPAQMQGSWISKHAQHSRLGSNPDIKYGGDVIDETAQKSAMNMGHSPAQMHKDGHIVEKPSKPDFPDIDGDGNTKESMEQAAKDKKSKE